MDRPSSGRRELSPVTAPTYAALMQEHGTSGLSIGSPGHLGSSSAPPAPLVPDAAAHFRLDPDIDFLNHGSFGALPRVVAEAQESWRRRIA